MADDDCLPIRVKAFHSEWDHVGVVVEMDRINGGSKGNDRRNNRKLVLLEANKTVVILRGDAGDLKNNKNDAFHSMEQLRPSYQHHLIISSY